jgi:hypothetical protein
MDREDIWPVVVMGVATGVMIYWLLYSTGVLL